MAGFCLVTFFLLRVKGFVSLPSACLLLLLLRRVEVGLPPPHTRGNFLFGRKRKSPKKSSGIGLPTRIGLSLRSAWGICCETHVGDDLSMPQVTAPLPHLRAPIRLIRRRAHYSGWFNHRLWKSHRGWCTQGLGIACVWLAHRPGLGAVR